jgi:hypothetical protein
MADYEAYGLRKVRRNSSGTKWEKVMAVHVYLEETIREEKGFVEGTGGKCATFMDSNIHTDGGILYQYLVNINDMLPESMNNHVAKVTFRDTFINNARREMGLYKNENGSAELVLGIDEIIHINAEAKCLGSLKELVQLIRTGEIGPIRSYDGPQTRKSRLWRLLGM